LIFKQFRLKCQGHASEGELPPVARPTPRALGGLRHRLPWKVFAPVMTLREKRAMAGSLRRLALGFILMAAAAAVLLLSDLGSRVSPVTGKTAGASGRPVRVAMLQHASQPVLDQGR